MYNNNIASIIELLCAHNDISVHDLSMSYRPLDEDKDRVYKARAIISYHVLEYFKNKEGKKYSKRKTYEVLNCNPTQLYRYLAHYDVLYAPKSEQHFIENDIKDKRIILVAHLLSKGWKYTPAVICVGYANSDDAGYQRIKSLIAFNGGLEKFIDKYAPKKEEDIIAVEESLRSISQPIRSSER